MRISKKFLFCLLYFSHLHSASLTTSHTFRARDDDRVNDVPSHAAGRSNIPLQSIFIKRDRDVDRPSELSTFGPPAPAPEAEAEPPDPPPLQYPEAAITTTSRGRRWEEDIDIHNNDWMRHLGILCRHVYGHSDTLQSSVTDLWGPQLLPGGRSIYYFISLQEGLGWRALPDVLSWAIRRPNDPALRTPAWAGVDVEHSVTPWLRTSEYLLSARTINPDNHVMHDLEIFILTGPNFLDYRTLSLYAPMHPQTAADRILLRNSAMAQRGATGRSIRRYVPSFWAGYGLPLSPSRLTALSTNRTLSN